MKTCPVGAELLNAEEQTDRQTDRHEEANSRFSQFCESTFKKRLAFMPFGLLVS
jgi:hypothetical protein